MSGVQHCSALSWISSSQVSLCRWGRLAFMFSDLPEWGSCVYRSSWSSLLLYISWESFRNPWENSRSFELFSVHWQTNRTAFLAHAKKKCAIQGDVMNHTHKWELCAHLVTDIMATPTSGSHYKTGDYLRILQPGWCWHVTTGIDRMRGRRFDSTLQTARLDLNCKLHFQRSHSSSLRLWIATLGVGVLLDETGILILYVSSLCFSNDGMLCPLLAQKGHAQWLP